MNAIQVVSIYALIMCIVTLISSMWLFLKENNHKTLKLILGFIALTQAYCVIYLGIYIAVNL